MRKLLILTAIATLAGCSNHGVVRHSPYDLNRDGVMDARCPGLEYETKYYHRYSWKSRASKECTEQSSQS